MFRSRSRRRVRVRTLIARITLTASVALAVGVGIANAQQTPLTQQAPQPQLAPGAQQSPPAGQQQPMQQQAASPQQQIQQSQPLSQPVQGSLNTNTVTTQTTIATTPTIVTSTLNSDPRTNLILGIPESHCGHVIDLLIRNRMRQQSGAIGAELAPGLVLSRSPLANSIGDLELIDVRLVSDGGPGAGPTIQVTVRNTSAFAVGNFQISIVGVLGQIHVQCPTVRGTVSQIPAGSTSSFNLQLPASAMAMGFQGQPSAPFDTIVVAVDSFDELVEANELNNVQILRRNELQPLTVVTEVTTSVAAPATPATIAPSVPTDTAVPSPSEPKSPLDGINVEELQLETTTPTAAGMAEFFRSSKTTGD